MIGVAIMTVASKAQQQSRPRQQYVRIKQHAHRNKEQHRERIAQRQCVGGRLMADFGLSDHHSGQKRAERHRHSKQNGRAGGHRQRNGQHGQREQFPGAGTGHLSQQPGYDDPATGDDDQAEQSHLQQRKTECDGNVPQVSAHVGGRVALAKQPGEGRHDHQDPAP